MRELRRNRRKARPCGYLLGPMSGYFDLNRPLFDEWATHLRGMGYEIINPAELDGEYQISPSDDWMVPEADWVACLARDLSVLIQRAEFGVTLPGWRDSRGATLEATVLSSLGRPLYEVPELRRIPPSKLPRIVHP